MGTPESTTAGRTLRARAAGLTDQPLTLLTVGAFWTWLVVRWTNDFLLDGALIERNTSFPDGTVRGGRVNVGGLAASLGPVGVPVGWVAGFFESWRRRFRTCRHWRPACGRPYC